MSVCTRPDGERVCACVSTPARVSVQRCNLKITAAIGPPGAIGQPEPNANPFYFGGSNSSSLLSGPTPIIEAACKDLELGPRAGAGHFRGTIGKASRPPSERKLHLTLQSRGSQVGLRPSLVPLVAANWLGGLEQADVHSRSRFRLTFSSRPNGPELAR